MNSVRYGFGVHHGRLPRAIASHMVRLFNEGHLPVLFCTSTLIEGVNTAAKTVFIYDKDINKAPYDFFTYSNIKGRAGRLGQHHVGRVYLFNETPDQEEMEVAPTLFADEDTAPLDYVVQLDDQPARKTADSRVTAIKAKLGLEGEEVRLAASVGLENAALLKSAVEKSHAASLQWTGFPRYEQIAAVVSLICEVRRANHFGAFTDKVLTYQINALRQAPSMRAFLTKYDAKYNGTAETYDNVFRFLRACEYGLPQWFALVQAFVRVYGGRADYSLFIVELSRWFKAEALKDLDEEGIPIQISERFHIAETKKELTAKLAELARSRSAELTLFERQWILSALEIRQRT